MERLATKLLPCCLMLGLCVALGPVAPASAQAVVGNDAWRVLEKHGSVRFQAPGAGRWSQASVGAKLPPGSRIVTGADGWVLIRHADGNLWVEPNARFALPAPDAPRVRQDVGNLHYRIIRTEPRRFEVETPYASLVVKGTAFDVRVAQALTGVDVARGWVEVTTPHGSTADLHAGQAARISGGAKPRLEVRPAAAQAFEPVQPHRAIMPAVRPLRSDHANRDAGDGDDQADERKGWFQRFFDTLQRSSSAPRTWRAGDGGGGRDGHGIGGSGSGSGGSGSAGR